MKEIEEYIESNTRLYEETKKEYEQTKSESERLRLKDKMDCYKYYVIGLQDAKHAFIKEMKKYIEEAK